MRIFVFHNGHRSEEITYDCSLRLRAASLFAVENSVIKICFVGGGGLKPESGTFSMRKYWQREFPELINPVLMLDGSNNTANTVKEIADYIKSKESRKDILLISSSYHLERIKFFAKRYGLDSSFEAAEDILLKTREFETEIEKYRRSLGYLLKIFKEKLLMIYLKTDPDQKLVGMFRSYERK